MIRAARTRWRRRDGARTAAAVLRRVAAAAAQADGAPARAALLYERADALAPGALDVAERLTLATGLGLLGRYEEAARAIEGARAAAGTRRARAACAERDAWLRARRGDTEGARVALERGLADADAAQGDGAVELRARLGRLLVTSGRFREALAIVAPLSAPAVRRHRRAPPRARVSLEAAVLAHAYLGQPERGARHPGARWRAAAVGDGRRAYLDALLAQLAGREAGRAARISPRVRAGVARR